MMDTQSLIAEFRLLKIDINELYLNRYLRFVSSFRSEDDKDRESHHILPSSLFPQYKSKTDAPWNRVILSSRAHYLAHWILMKALPGCKQSDRAFWAMTAGCRSNNRRYRISSSAFSIARAKFRESMQGENHPNYGKSESTESIEKRRLKLVAHYSNPDIKISLRESRKAIWNEDLRSRKSEEVKKYLSNEDNLNKMIESINTESVRLKKSEYHRLHKINGDDIQCPYCPKVSKYLSPMNKWHFDNCKYKQSARLAPDPIKYFIVTDPDRASHEGRAQGHTSGLGKFCDDNNLNREKMYLVCSGKARSHKGWTGRYEMRLPLDIT